MKAETPHGGEEDTEDQRLSPSSEVAGEDPNVFRGGVFPFPPHGEESIQEISVDDASPLSEVAGEDPQFFGLGYGAGAGAVHFATSFPPQGEGEESVQERPFGSPFAGKGPKKLGLGYGGVFPGEDAVQERLVEETFGRASPERFGLGYYCSDSEAQHTQAAPRIYAPAFVRAGYDAAAAKDCRERRIPTEDPALKPEYFTDVSPRQLSRDLLAIIFSHLPMDEDKARFRSVCHAWKEVGRDLDLSKHQTTRANEIELGSAILCVLSENRNKSIDYFLNNCPTWMTTKEWSEFIATCTKFVWLMAEPNLKIWFFEDVKRVVHGLYKSHPC